MLNVSGISKSFGSNIVLHNVSFVVSPGQRIGLLGPNGCGKTTLLRIVTGEEAPDAGSVQLSPPNATVGYLAQALEYGPGDTVGWVMREARGGLLSAQAELRWLEERMAHASQEELEPLLTAYGRAQAEFERLGGYDLSHRIDQILGGLGLDQVGQDTPVEILSGGQKTRLGLARLLLTDPQLLLLDEPTNHLDIQALEWLEGFLQRYKGAVIIVSHDRAFLDQTVSLILELDPATHTVTEYPGDYKVYAAAKERELDEQWRVYKDQQERIDRYQRAIRGLSDKAQRIEDTTVHYHWRKQAMKIARRAVTQRGRLERMLDSEDRVDKPQPTWQIKLAFDQVPASGKDVVMLQDVAMAYGDLALFDGVSLSLRQGERVVLVGPNGSGKTTLLRIIAGEIAPLAGTVKLGANVKLGAYSQEQEGLDDASTPLQEVWRCAACSETEARSFLHYFLFGGDDVFKRVGDLSYGERARLALAKLVASGCNLLLLDEPINHLDIPSRESLERALTEYTGTVLAVVHDRYFIRRFATRVWAMEGGVIRSYPTLDDVRRGPGSGHA